MFEEKVAGEKRMGESPLLPVYITKDSSDVSISFVYNGKSFPFNILFFRLSKTYLLLFSRSH